jgi:hypothetical protein
MKRKHYLLSVEIGGVENYAVRNLACIVGYKLSADPAKAETFGENIKKRWLAQYPSGRAEAVGDEQRPDLEEIRQIKRELQGPLREKPRKFGPRMPPKLGPVRPRAVKFGPRKPMASSVPAEEMTAYGRDTEPGEEMVTYGRGVSNTSWPMSAARNFRRLAREYWDGLSLTKKEELVERLNFAPDFEGDRSTIQSGSTIDSAVGRTDTVAEEVANIIRSSPEFLERHAERIERYRKLDAALKYDRNLRLSGIPAPVRFREDLPVNKPPANDKPSLPLLSGFKTYEEAKKFAVAQVRDLRIAHGIEKPTAYRGYSVKMLPRPRKDREGYDSRLEAFEPEDYPPMVEPRFSEPVTKFEASESPFWLSIFDHTPAGFDPITPQHLLPSNLTRDGMREWFVKNTSHLPIIPADVKDGVAWARARAVEAADEAFRIKMQTGGKRLWAYFRPDERKDAPLSLRPAGRKDAPLSTTASHVREFSRLRGDYTRADKAYQDARSELERAYGTVWKAPSGKQKKLEPLSRRQSKASDKFYDLLRKISPRQWEQGVPTTWVLNNLSYEDAVRPADEPLQDFIPTAYGAEIAQRAQDAGLSPVAADAWARAQGWAPKEESRTDQRTPKARQQEKLRNIAESHPEEPAWRREKIAKSVTNEPIKEFWASWNYWATRKNTMEYDVRAAELANRVKKYGALKGRALRMAYLDAPLAFITYANEIKAGPYLANLPGNTILQINGPPTKGYKNPTNSLFILLTDGTWRGLKMTGWNYETVYAGGNTLSDVAQNLSNAKPSEILTFRPGSKEHARFMDEARSEKDVTPAVITLLREYTTGNRKKDAPGGIIRKYGPIDFHLLTRALASKLIERADMNDIEAIKLTDMGRALL